MRASNRGQEAIDPDWAFVLVPDYIMIPRDSLSKKHTETETENGNKCRHTYMYIATRTNHTNGTNK